MNNIKAYLYSVKEEDCAADKWDYGLLKEIFNKYKIDEIKTTNLPKSERAFVVIPGPQNIGNEEQINEELKNISRLVLFINGDEEGKFNIKKINHSNAEIWVQYPYPQHKHCNKLPIGVPQHLKKMIPKYPNKKYDLYFSGQITHQRRQQLAEVMPGMPNSLYNPTAGFAQGGDPKDYYAAMSTAKIAPAPSGAATVDTFRFFEAIEMLCLPIGDLINSKGRHDEFYKYVFGYDIPVKFITNWNEIKDLVPKLLEDYPANMHRVVAWWIKAKRDIGIEIMRQVNE